MVLKLDRIGDFVLALGAIRMVMRRFGEGNCGLVIAPGVMELARREFPLVTLIALPAFVRHKRALPAWWHARAALADIVCDHLVCLRHQRWDYDELALGWIRAVKIHVLEDPRAAAWVKDRRSVGIAAELYVEHPVAPGLCRELELHRQVLAGLLGAAPSAAEVLPQLTARSGAQEENYVVVMPFSSATIKDLPTFLLRELAAQTNIWVNRKILIVGAADQRDRLSALAAEMSAHGKRSFEVMRPREVTDLVDLIGGAAWVLTADTAAAHIATALDRPAVILLGGGTYGQFGPWERSSRQRWISHHVPCYQCGWQCPHPEPWCLTRIASVEVAAALLAVTS